MSELFYKAAGAVLAPFRYAEREVEHLKEVAKEDLQAFIANAIKMAILSAAGLLFLLFLSIMAAAWINQAMESEFIGFAIVAGFYLLVTVAVYISKVVTDNKKEAHDHKKKVHANTPRRPIGA